MDDISSLFPESYASSRNRFRLTLDTIRSLWPAAGLSSHPLAGGEDLTIDWIYSPALQKNHKVILLTTGEHGVEGYVGSAMQQRFIELFLPQLDPRDTGILLVHAINPWGMQHHRRVNPNNVDLNRNFLWHHPFDPAFNPGYARVDQTMNPTGIIKHKLAIDLNFYWHLLLDLLHLGKLGFEGASLVGQYRYPHGLYYGGSEYQPETRAMIELYRQTFAPFDQILHLDMHTGYGPRYQMSVVNSAYEPRSSQEFVDRFAYPLVVAVSPEEFYPIQGDMIDYVYALCQHEFPQKRLYACSFEFGTEGKDALGLVHCPPAMVHENHLFWHGATRDPLKTRIQHDFEELFNPSALAWRAKALADADQAFTGILTAEGFIHP
jgi:predicted deacylase